MSLPHSLVLTQNQLTNGDNKNVENNNSATNNNNNNKLITRPDTILAVDKSQTRPRSGSFDQTVNKIVENNDEVLRKSSFNAIAPLSVIPSKRSEVYV